MAEVSVSSTWSSAYPVDSGKLVAKVARLYGLAEDADAKALALDFLDDAVKELNTRLFEFNVVSQTGIAMTANQSYVQLAVPFFKEKMAFLVKVSDSKPSYPLRFIDWPAFQRLYGNPSEASDVPAVYSIRNMQEEGRVYLAPTPASSVATDYTLTLEYYRRIPLPSEQDQLTVFQEAENAIVFGGQMRFAQHIAGPDSPDVGTLKALATEAEMRLKSLDRRHPDELTRFRLYDDRMRGPFGRRRSLGFKYIRID